MIFTPCSRSFGRASRNIDGTVIMYADNITQSMKEAISETERRRKKQMLYNQKHGITPKTIVKAVAKREDDAGINVEIKSMSAKDLSKLAIEIETNMKRYAEDLDFEKAIQLRDQLTKIRKVLDSQIVEAPSR
jgi:excinuclease ABC subunit B